MRWFLSIWPDGTPKGWSNEPKGGYFEVSVKMRQALGDPEKIYDAATGTVVDRPTRPEGVPETAMPRSITMRQCRLMLLRHDMLDAINAMVNEMSAADKIEWEYASEVRLDHPLVAGIAQALGMTTDQMRQMFVEAANL